MAGMGVAISEDQLKKVLNKLDDVKIELLRLRAALLPEERPTAKELRQVREAKREVSEGKSSTLKEILDELGE